MGLSSSFPQKGKKSKKEISSVITTVGTFLWRKCFFFFLYFFSLLEHSSWVRIIVIMYMHNTKPNIRKISISCHFV